MKRRNVWKMLKTLVLMSIVPVIMCGCGKEERDIKELVYEGAPLPCMSQVEGDITAYTVMGDFIYIYATTWSAPSEEVTDIATFNRYFYKCKADGSEFSQISMDVPNNCDEWLNLFRVSEKGEYYILYNFLDASTGKIKYILRILDNNGKLLWETDVAAAVGDTEKEEFIIYGMELDREGHIYLLAEESIFLFDGEGVFIAEMKEGNALTQMAVTDEGQVIVYISSEDAFYIRTVDGERLEFGEKMDIALNSYNYTSLISGSRYDFYYSDGSSIFAYDMKKRRSYELLDWVSSNVNTNYIGETRALADGSFVTHYYNYMGDSGETDEKAEAAENALYIFTKVNPEDVKEKTEITYGALYVDDTLREQVVKYNNSQEQYRVVVEDYSASNNPAADMHRDIMEGKIPDIIDMSGLPSEAYIAQGMLVDLYTFMENESDVKREDFIDNVVRIMETDEKLYRITPMFGLNAMIGKEYLLKGEESLTLEALRGLEVRKKGAKAFYMNSASNVLAQIFAADYHSFVDWEKGVCSFDSEEFVRLLAYADTYPADEELDWTVQRESYADLLREDKILFAAVAGMTVEELQLYQTMFDDAVAFAGYPSAGENGAAITMNMELAISADSLNPEAAWEFLKTFLTREYISANPENYSYGFPLREDCLEDIIKRYSAKSKYTDDFGNAYLPYESKWSYENIQVEIKPLSEGEAELLREVILGAKHMYVYDEEIMHILAEETENYFHGDYSPEQAAGNIQTKVAAYMKEILEE